MATLGQLPAWANLREAYDCQFLLDANCVNARGKDANLNQLEHWSKCNVIGLDMSVVSAAEAATGSKDREEKVKQHLQWMTDERTPEEQGDLRQIGDILFPFGTQTVNQQNDVEIVFAAKKYNKILITNDGGSVKQPGGILGNAVSLKDKAGVRVMRPSEAVAHVRKGIAARDFAIRTAANEYQATPPSWVGQDG